MERAVLTATAIAGLAVVVLTVIAQGLFSYRGMDEMLIPAISVARSVRLGRILERLDAMMLGAWLLVAFLGKTYLIYLAAIRSPGSDVPATTGLYVPGHRHRRDDGDGLIAAARNWLNG